MQDQQQPKKEKGKKIPKVMFDFNVQMDDATIANQLAVLRAQKLHTERMLKTDESKLRHLVEHVSLFIISRRCYLSFLLAYPRTHSAFIPGWDMSFNLPCVRLFVVVMVHARSS